MAASLQLHQKQGEGKVSGIVFFKTRMLNELKEFYINKLKCELWLEQAECVILRNGNLLLGFCQRETPDLEGMITFFYKTSSEVDQAYEQFKSCATTTPKMNEKYRIYHFFGKDPEKRSLEFQYFDHELPPY